MFPEDQFQEILRKWWKKKRSVIRDMELACDALRGKAEAERYVKGVQEMIARILDQLQQMKASQRPQDE